MTTMRDVPGEALPRTRAEAKKVGAKHYFTGKECSRGHVAAKYACDGKCVDCVRERNATSEVKAKRREREATPEAKEKRREYDAKYYAKPEAKEKKRGYMAKRYATPEAKEKQQAAALRHRYKLTQADYDLLMSKQNNCCAICKQPFTKTPCVDHCHATERATGKKLVRGLLCDKCNRGIGYFNDGIERLLAAAEYLERAALPEPTNRRRNTQPETC